MKIPTDIEIIERPSATFWFDEDGILNVVAKNVTRDLEMIKSNGEFLKKLLNGKKVCCLYDITSSGPINAEGRALVKKQLPYLYKAVAIVTKSTLGRMLGTMIYVIMPSNIPTKIFSDETEAKDWLKEYL